jgi:restriction endonuclease Mrr
MTVANADMTDLNEQDRAVLTVLAEGRSNPLLIRDRTGFGKGTVNTSLNRLSRTGHVTQVVRGLYRITEKGEQEVNQ